MTPPPRAFRVIGEVPPPPILLILTVAACVSLWLILIVASGVLLGLAWADWMISINKWPGLP
jgi:hypothetical protein